MNNYDKIITSKIRPVRIKAGVSQTELGEALGVTFQQVQKYETGVNRVSVGTLQAICEFLKIDINYFFEDENEFTIDKTDAAIFRNLSKIKCNKKKRFISYVVKFISTLND